jgi:hypothetical protein
MTMAKMAKAAKKITLQRMTRRNRHFSSHADFTIPVMDSFCVTDQPMPGNEGEVAAMANNVISVKERTINDATLFQYFRSREVLGGV